MKKPGSREPKVGINSAAEILAGLSEDERTRLLESMRKSEPETAKKVEAALVSKSYLNNIAFEALTSLPQETLSHGLGQVPKETLSMALRGCKAEFQAELLKSLPKRLALEILDEIKHAGPRRLKDVEQARNEICLKFTIN